MSVVELERPVAKIIATTVRVSSGAAELLRKVATLKNTSIAEYVDAKLVAIIEQDLNDEAEKITRKSRPNPKR